MSWVAALAEWLAAAAQQPLPPEIAHAGCRVTLDSVACALGALDHPATQPVGAVVRALGGTAESSLIGAALGGDPAPGRTTALNATLFNGTLIRALDCNDIYFHDGVGGHGSDTLSVALAFAEAERATGAEYLTAVALGYELQWRLRHDIGPPAAGSYPWDHVSMHGIIAAALAGLLLRLDAARLAHAMAIGGAQSYSLAEIRGGEISMLKAAAAAVTAQLGAMGALLARAGMTGPPELLEGRRGMLKALSRPVDAEILHQLTLPIDRWHILDSTMKPYPSIGTSQSAIAATLELVRAHQLTADDVARVEVQFADLPVARAQIGDAVRVDPTTRETADHSFPFLVAVAIEDGDVGPAQFAGDRWLRPATRELMRRVAFSIDPRLNAHTATGFPAAVTIHLVTGGSLQQDMVDPPGSPQHQLADAQLGDKLRRLALPSWSPTQLATLERAIFALPQCANITELGSLLRGESQG